MLVNAEGEMHRQVFRDIESVDEQIANLEKLTQESIAILEEKKREIRREADPNASFSKVGSKLKLMEGDRKLSASDLDTILNEIDREISRIQAEHDTAVIDLQNRKASMKKRLSSIEKLDLLINVLTYKIFETQYEFRQEMDATLRFKESILNKTGEPSNEDAIELAEIEKKLADCKNMHESVMTSLEGQRAELQRETAMKVEHMDTVLISLKNQHDKMYADLEQQKIDASPSYIDEICRRLEELDRLFEKDTENLKLLQSQGWKNITSEERIADLLQARGLRVTKSGNFLTSSGLRITQSEASCLGLLEGINMPRLKVEEEVVKEIKTPDSMTTLSSETTSEGTTESEMSSEDVEYLKKALGRPLTLALAEITAKQPRDPIHYLGHWLFKYRYNQEVDLKRKQEIQDLIEERDRLEREKLHAMIEEEARAAVINMVIRAEEEAIRRELERLARETYMYEDEEELHSEARDVLGVYDGPTAGQRIPTT